MKRILVAAFLFAVSVGVSAKDKGFQAYDGPKLPEDSVSTLKVKNGVCLVSVDAYTWQPCRSPRLIKLLPGTHAFAFYNQLSSLTSLPRLSMKAGALYELYLFKDQCTYDAKSGTIIAPAKDLQELLYPAPGTYVWPCSTVRISLVK